MKKILFITWDGPQTNYLKGLFLPIFVELKKLGLEFYIIQFSWNDKEYIENMTKYCSNLSIEYKHIRVCRKPVVALGALFTSIASSVLIRKAIKKWKIDIVMPRSTLPALSSLLAVTEKSNVKIIFDADGLPLDERVEFNNVDPLSFSHNLLRFVENQALMRADQILVRSNKAIDILHSRIGAGFEFGKFNTVCNGRDENIFRIYSTESNEKVREELGVKLGQPLVAYVGSLAPQYCIKEMLYLFSLIRNVFTDAKLLMISGDHQLLIKELKKYENLHDHIIMKTLSHDDVGRYLSSCDLGLAIRKKSFSMQAVAPIKIGEYMMCGLPIIATSGIGDTHMIDSDSGFLLDSNSKEELELAAAWFESKRNMLKSNASHIQKLGKNEFSINSSVIQYKNALDKIQ